MGKLIILLSTFWLRTRSVARIAGTRFFESLSRFWQWARPIAKKFGAAVVRLGIIAAKKGFELLLAVMPLIKEGKERGNGNIRKVLLALAIFFFIVVPLYKNGYGEKVFIFLVALGVVLALVDMIQKIGGLDKIRLPKPKKRGRTDDDPPAGGASPSGADSSPPTSTPSSPTSTPPATSKSELDMKTLGEFLSKHWKVLWIALSVVGMFFSLLMGDVFGFFAWGLMATVATITLFDWWPATRKLIKEVLSSFVARTGSFLFSKDWGSVVLFVLVSFAITVLWLVFGPFDDETTAGSFLQNAMTLAMFSSPFVAVWLLRQSVNKKQKGGS